MKKKLSLVFLAVCATLLSGYAQADETATIIHVEKNCKYYVAKSSSGFHVLGAINHNAPPKDTKILGDFSKSGFKDMSIGDSKSAIYMDLVFNKLTSLDEAKKELEFKCMEAR